MTRKKIVALTLVVPLVLAAFWFYRQAEANPTSSYRFVQVEQGDLEATVSATGTLNAVTTVQVGTQVSGQVAELLADFNDRVERGQLIARIDPTLARQSVREAEASLERSRAEMQKAQRDFERNRTLYERQVLTESEFSDAEYSLTVARASLKSAEVSLERARQNLSYTNIYAPIDGIVVQRDVDVGQTVAASLSAPELFLIAQDLAEMQILASVDESDIGLIREGQGVVFTVQAYPDESFTGVVEQVRLQSSSSENVVNYTVVVSVENQDGRLLPGMTATVDFVIEEANGVMMVPNAALRFRPTPEMLASFSGRADGAGPGENGARAGGPRAGGAGAPGARGGAPARANDTGVLWYLDARGELAMARVRTGITDGVMTVIEGSEISDGMQVIAAVTQSATSGSSNPFQSQDSGPRRRGGAF